MPRITALNPDTATGKTKELFNAVQSKFGMVPNLTRTFGNSPAVLNAYLSFSGALGESAIGGQLAELIALTVANANGCEYCNSAHSFISEKLAGLSAHEIADARVGVSHNAKTQAALTFAREILAAKGKVSNDAIAAVRNAGFDDAAISEIIAHTALNIFTNYFNNVAQTTVDFPKAELVEEAFV